MVSPRVADCHLNVACAIQRDDVATTLYHLALRSDAHGFILDVVDGPTLIAEALDLAIKKGESDFMD